MEVTLKLKFINGSLILLFFLPLEKDTIRPVAFLPPDHFLKNNSFLNLFCKGRIFLYFEKILALLEFFMLVGSM